MLCPFCIKFNTCPDPEGVRDKESRSTPTGSPQSYRVPQQYWPRGYKTFSCSTQLSTEFQLLIKTKIPTNKEVVCFSL